MPTVQQDGTGAVRGGPKVIDGYLTTGSSPGDQVTVHLLGLGSVGRALVRRLSSPEFRIVGLSDRSGTLIPQSRDDALDAVLKKAAGTPLKHSPEALDVPLSEALSRTRPDIVVDATHTDLVRTDWHNFLEHSVLRRAGKLALASKDALCRRGPAWGEEFGFEHVRFNAVLGGTGGTFISDLPKLRAEMGACAIAGNASTTAIVEAVEQGGSIDDGSAHADHLGLLEPDPELDLRGVDAATKLAIVVGLLTNRTVDPGDLAAPDVRDLSVDILRRRRSSGSTTRLVGRYSVGGRPLLRFEELPLGHPLAVAQDEVIYRYVCRSGECVDHSGRGLGADATADAVIADLFSFVGSDAGVGGVR